MPARRPVCGPYGETYTNQRTGKCEARLTATGREFVERYLAEYPNPLSLAMRSQYCRPLALAIAELDGWEAASQVAMEGVVYAAVKYDPSRLNKDGNPVAFSTVVTVWMRNRLRDHLPGVGVKTLYRRRDKERFLRLRTVSGDAEFGSEYGVPVTLFDLVAVDGGEPVDSLLDLEELRAVLDRAVAALPPVEREVVRSMCSGDRETMAEIGERFHMGRRDASEFRRRALLLLAGRLDDWRGTV